MSIATYSELKAAVSDWLERPEIATRIPDFINLAESQMLRKLTYTDTETTATITGDGSTEYDLAADYKQMRSVIGSGGAPLVYKAPDQFNTISQYDITSMSVYTLLGNTIKFLSALATGGTVTYNYIATFTRLSDAAPTNWFLTTFPDCYLAGALQAAYEYMMDDAKTAYWGSKFAIALEEIDVYLENQRFPSPLAMGSD